MKQLFVLIILLSMAFVSKAAAIAEMSSGSLVGAPKAKWRGIQVRMAFSTSLTKFNPNIKSDSDIAGAISRSIDAWKAVTSLDLRIEASEKQSVSPNSSSGDGVSLITAAQTPENVLFFSGDGPEVSAKTRVFIDRRGNITEADIVLNPFAQFSTDGTFGTFDLQTVITHEIGHLLGLRHSDVLGAVMYKNLDRNEIFTEQRSRTRKLSEDDISAIRAKYGWSSNEGDCCGIITGKISGSDRLVKGSVVFAIDGDGRVVAHASVENDRSFRLAGLESGKTAVIWADALHLRNSTIQKIGNVDVKTAETSQLSARVDVSKRDFAIRFLGTNGVLTDSGVRLTPGETYTLFVGGENISAKGMKIGFDSKYLSVNRSLIADVDYADGISAIKFELSVDNDTPAGDYMIYVISDEGTVDSLFGAISVSQPYK